MIKILLDEQIFNEQKFGGISRYFTEIHHELNQIEEVEITCPLLYTDNIHFKESPQFKDSYQSKHSFLIKFSKIFRSYSPKRLKKRNVEQLATALTNQDFDVFIPTYYNPDFLEHLGNKSFVLTVYDMIHELFPEYLSPDKITIPNKKLLLEKATKIIAISHNTKKDILEIYPHLDASKIEVVHLASSIIKNDNIKLNLPKKYILFVGQRWYYKNFRFFLNAIASLLQQDPELYLVCAGGKQFDQDEIQLITDLNLLSKVLQMNFDDAELSHYYENAQCFVFPSQYEGFGIPVLEAMACGCPVVLANHSSFPEVAGDAGIYFELNDAEDLKNKVSYLLESNTARAEYKEKGLAQASKFNWQRTAYECLEVYKKTI